MTLDMNLGRVARKRLAVRYRLLRAGLELGGAHGIENMSVNDVTEQADCSVGTFYTHFENKDAFVTALIDEAITPVSEALSEHKKSVSDPREALAIGLRYVLYLATKDIHWGEFVIATTWSKGTRAHGFAVGLIEDLQKGRDEGLFLIEDMPAAISILVGAAIAGVIAASEGLLTDESAAHAARHVLLAYGVSLKVAGKIVVKPLPDLDIQSNVIDYDLQATIPSQQISA